MKGKKYILLKSKIPVWLKYWFYKKGGVTPVLKNLYLGYSRQNTTTGKNKMPLSSYDSTEQRQKIFNIGLSAGTYTVSFDLESFELGTNTSFILYMALYGESQVIDKNILSINEDTTTGRKYVNFAINADSLITSNSNIRISNTAYTNGGEVEISNIQIEAGTEATSFEQYTGGIPAPNYQYPMSIDNIVSDTIIQTGTKTVTFPIVGGQKLYANDMLVDRNIKNTKTTVILDGTETVTKGTSSSSLYNYYLVNKTLTKVPKYNQDLRASLLCSHFRAMFNATAQYIDNGISLGSNLNRFIIACDSITTAEDFKAFLVDQYTNGTPVTIEYELAEPETVAYTNAQLQAYTNLCKYFGENTDLNNYIVGG